MTRAVPSLRQGQLLDLMADHPQMGRGRPVPVLLRCSSTLDQDRLQRALDALARRHEPLRSSFTRGADGWTVLLTAPDDARVPMATVDGSGMAHQDITAHALATSRGVSTMETCFSALHYRGAGGTSWVLLLFDHLVVDWISVKILLHHLSSLYEEAGSIPLVDLQYYDFALSQRRAIASGAAADDLEYWQQQFACYGPWPLVEVPSLRGRPPGQPAPARVVSRRLASTLVRALDVAGQRRHVLRYSMFLAGACRALDQLVGGQPPDFGVLIVTSGRGQWPQASRMAGFFTDYLAVGLGPLPERAEGLLALVHERVMIALGHDGVPRGEMLARYWKGSSELPAGPCVLFDMPMPRQRLNPPTARLASGLLELEVVRLQDSPPIRRYPGLALRVIGNGREEGPTLSCEFAEGDVETAVVEELIEGWEAALGDLAKVV